MTMLVTTMPAGKGSGGANGDGGEANVNLLGNLLVEPAIQGESCGCGRARGKRAQQHRRARGRGMELTDTEELAENVIDVEDATERACCTWWSERVLLCLHGHLFVIILVASRTYMYL